MGGALAGNRRYFSALVVPSLVGLGAIFAVLAQADADPEPIWTSWWMTGVGACVLAAITLVWWGLQSPKLICGELVRSRVAYGGYAYDIFRLPVTNARTGTTAQGTTAQVSMRQADGKSVAVQTFWKHEPQAVRPEAGEIDIPGGATRSADVLLYVSLPHDPVHHVLLRHAPDNEDRGLPLAEGAITVLVKARNVRRAVATHMQLRETDSGWELVPQRS